MSQAWEQVSGVSAAEGSTLEDLNESGLRDELGLEKLWEALATTNRSAIEEEEGLNSAWEGLGSLGEEHLDTAWAEGVRAYEVFFSLSHARPHSSHMSQPHTLPPPRICCTRTLSIARGTARESKTSTRSARRISTSGRRTICCSWEPSSGKGASSSRRSSRSRPRYRRVAHKSRTSRAQVSRKSRARRARVARTSRAHKSHTQVPHKSHTRLPPHRSHVISHPNLTTQASHAFPPHSSQRH